MRRFKRLYSRLFRPLRLLALRFMRWYLRRAGRATRDGVANGGYIVHMSADDYHRYTVLAQNRTPEDFHAIVWAARDRGVFVP